MVQKRCPDCECDQFLLHDAAHDGEEALEKAVRERPALIVLDVILPKKNGFQVCRQLKTSSETSDIKVLLLTSKN